MEQINHSIACSVDNCAFHAGNQGYCTLNAIKVGRSATEDHCCDNTECASFQDSGKRSKNC